MSEQASGSPSSVHSQDGGEVKDDVVGRSTPPNDLSSSEVKASSELVASPSLLSQRDASPSTIGERQSIDAAHPVTANDNDKTEGKAVAVGSIDAEIGDVLGGEIGDANGDIAKLPETVSDAEPSTEIASAKIAEDRDVKYAIDVNGADTVEVNETGEAREAKRVQGADRTPDVSNDAALASSDQDVLPAVEAGATSLATENVVEVSNTTSSEMAAAPAPSQPSPQQSVVKESIGDQEAADQSVTAAKVNDTSQSSQKSAAIDATYSSPKPPASDKSSLEEKAASTEVLSQDKPASDVAIKESEVISSEVAQPTTDPLTIKQIALLLKINKELIRLCVDLQAKEAASDPIFREAATRLQTNLAFLASLAEPNKDSSSGDAKPAVALNHEPFPSTAHSPDSLLPKLYSHLRSVTISSANQSQSSPNSLGKRRRRPSDEISAAKLPRSQTPVESHLKSTHSSPSSHTSLLDRRQSNSVVPNSMAAATFAASPLSATSSLPTQPHVANANAMMASSSRASTPLNSEMQNRPLASPGAALPTSSADSQVNGVRPNGIAGPTPQQLQGLVQAFGQNAVNNLNALQAHYRGGQNQASVAYMESNVPNFRTLPLQAQLQHMANVQNTAMQRQRQMSMSSASSPGVSQQQQQQAGGGGSHAGPPTTQRRPSAALSPSPSLNVDQLRRSTQSPSAAPATPANVNMSFGMNMTSPSAASAPSPSMMGHMQQQQSQAQQPQQTAQMQQMTSSLPASLHNMPPHLQQQLVQHFLQQQQQQQQQQPQMANNQSMAPPSAGGMNPMMLAMLQQQQQQQNANTPMHMSQIGFRPSMSPQAWPNTPQQQQPPPS